MSWNERYATDEWLFGTEPSEFLVEHKHLFTSGQKVLAIGDGEGRNGVWLAKQGLEVTTLDIAENAVNKAQRLARRESINIEALCQDIVTWDWPSQHFDAVVSIFVHLPPHDRHLVNRRISTCLKPAGLFFLEAYHKKQIEYATAGPTDSGMLYDEAEILSEFSTMKTLHISTQETEIRDKDGSSTKGCSVQFAGRRSVIN
ncbi:MAG: class I SAM-dependent methyltransferase [Gammaproteobacteria bacterium]|nr:class I SAM-dependent methyltransferase [Gammaproteobacteria bacterium]